MRASRADIAGMFGASIFRSSPSVPASNAGTRFATTQIVILSFIAVVCSSLSARDDLLSLLPMHSSVVGWGRRSCPGDTYPPRHRLTSPNGPISRCASQPTSRAASESELDLRSYIKQGYTLELCGPNRYTEKLFLRDR